MKNTITLNQLEELLEAGYAKYIRESKHKYYIVSKFGKVYSQSKKNSELIIQLSESSDSNSYPIVGISGKTTKVHRLVSEAFIPNPENKPCIDHIDGIKNHNDISGTIYPPNLRWSSYKENIGYAWHEQGLINDENRQNLKKTLHKKRKLTFEQAEEIRNLYKSENIGQRELSRMFNCNVNTIRQIINNKSYTYKSVN